MVLYTDGIVDAENDHAAQFGLGRLVRTIRDTQTLNARGMVEGVFGATERFLGRTRQNDDMTVVAVRRMQGDPSLGACPSRRCLDRGDEQAV
jgi:sigma-B regulation protein RsbU (phosphoserine phosphatase)